MKTDAVGKAVSPKEVLSGARYCGMCDRWFRSPRVVECPLCGAKTDKAENEAPRG